MNIKMFGHLAIAFMALSLVSCGRLPGTHTSTSTETDSPTNTPLSPAIPPQYNPRGELTQLIKDIHDLYEKDFMGCRVVPGPGTDMPYDEAAEEMIRILVSHPLAQSLTLAERSDIFYEVTEYEIHFKTDSGDTTLVWLPDYHDCTHSSHYRAGHIIYMVGADGALWEIGNFGGRVQDTRWIDDRWVLLINLKLDGSSGPTPWSVVHIGQVGEDWEAVVDFKFSPAPYVSRELPVQFEDGYQTMIANMVYLRGDRPCQFSSEFIDVYDIGNWGATNTYHLIDGQYELIDAQVNWTDISRRDTGEWVSIDWQDYCISPTVYTTDQ